MLLDGYEKQGLLFNVNFKEATRQAGLGAYRGDLVLVEGEIADAQGRRKPPLVALTGAVMLADQDKIKLMAGALDDLADLQPLVGKYQADFAPGMQAVLYVLNIGKPMQVAAGGVQFVCIPMTDGMVWNELVDEVKLEKGDFKGQSGGDKVLTVFQAFADYRPKYAVLSLEEALTQTVSARREERGAI